MNTVDYISEIIKRKVLAKDWTFNEISNLKETIESLASDTYEEIKLIERFDLIREIRIKESFVGHVFEDVIRETVMTSLRAEVADTVRNMLNNATVNFGGNKMKFPREVWSGSQMKNAPPLPRRIVRVKKNT